VLVHASTPADPAVRRIHYCFSFTVQTQTPYNCGRNFGPNLYITPPGTFTQIHQDGCGTVDSGHYCHRGYNEVIMLKRGTEKEMKEAEEILVGKSVYDSTEPHFEGKKPGWPTRTAIEECETKLG
jgi:hypothetical protein